MQELLPAFETFIVEAAKECAKVKVVARSDWFASNEPELLLRDIFVTRCKKLLTILALPKQKTI
jgi:hypothetical protein